MCQFLMRLDTEWHKTTKTSSIAASFWMDNSALLATPAEFTMEDAVVTAATGAFGKPEHITGLTTEPFPFYQGGDIENYRLKISYKVGHGGWGLDPTIACKLVACRLRLDRRIHFSHGIET